MSKEGVHLTDRNLTAHPTTSIKANFPFMPPVARHADAVALEEADETWPQIVEDADCGELKEIYAPLDATGKERKPSLNRYATIPWDKLHAANSTWFPN